MTMIQQAMAAPKKLYFGTGCSRGSSRKRTRLVMRSVASVCLSRSYTYLPIVWSTDFISRVWVDCIFRISMSSLNVKVMPPRSRWQAQIMAAVILLCLYVLSFCLVYLPVCFLRLLHFFRIFPDDEIVYFGVRWKKTRNIV